jgi:metal-responsive CopG/Arc/MetJ family transcriptional regulator
MKKTPGKTSISLVVPTKLAELVDEAAKKQFSNSSIYIRQAVARALKADGLEVA